MASKFEGKYDEEAGGKTSSATKNTVAVDVTSINVSPNNCSLESELNLVIEYDCDVDVGLGSWSVQYMVDSVRKRHIIKLGTVELRAKAGKNTFEFSVEKIDISGIRPSRLANVGLLSAILSSDSGEEIITINMVVQVTKSTDAADEGKAGGDTPTFVRCVYNPLE